MSLSHTVSTGKGFRSGAGGWFWLRVSLMRLQSDVWLERRSPLPEERLTQIVDKLVPLLAGGISSAACRLSWVSSWHDSRFFPDKVTKRTMRKWKFFFTYSYLCHIHWSHSQPWFNVARIYTRLWVSGGEDYLGVILEPNHIGLVSVSYNYKNPVGVSDWISTLPEAKA